MKWIVWCGALLFFQTGYARTRVDLILHHGTIYTLDKKFSKAQVLVIDHGKIIACGREELMNRYESDQVIDLNGRYVYPGFSDAHCHFTAQAMDAAKLKLFGTRSFAEILHLLREWKPATGAQWLEATGWDQNEWPEKKFPEKDSLDIYFPDTPVFLLRVDGHAALVNQRALDIAGIRSDTKMEGGEVVLKNGKPTGILIDRAMEEVLKQIPSVNEEQFEHNLLSVLPSYYALGLTALTEPGIPDEWFSWLEKVYSFHPNLPSLSVFLNGSVSHVEAWKNRSVYYKNQLHMLGFKLYADGALGSRGACLLQDYHDQPHHRGHWITSADSLYRMARMVEPTLFQLSVHAIGDEANRVVLKTYARVLKGHNNRRWRIEHAQVVHPADLSMFSQYDIIPSVQPSHAMGDFSWAVDRIGTQRVKTAYAYQQLLKNNHHWLPLGTDYPVESLNPLHTFCTAVFRQNEKGMPVQGFQKENALTRKQALYGITLWPAQAAFEENVRGSLEPGKEASFVILDLDLMKARRAEIEEARVLKTFLRGKEVFSN